MRAEPLIDLVLRVRARGGRPCTEADRARLVANIATLTQGEVTQQRTTLNALLDHADNATTTKNRDKP